MIDRAILFISGLTLLVNQLRWFVKAFSSAVKGFQSRHDLPAPMGCASVIESLTPGNQALLNRCRLTAVPSIQGLPKTLLIVSPDATGFESDQDSALQEIAWACWRCLAISRIFVIEPDRILQVQYSESGGCWHGFSAFWTA